MLHIMKRNLFNSTPGKTAKEVETSRILHSNIAQVRTSRAAEGPRCTTRASTEYGLEGRDSKGLSRNDTLLLH